MTDPTADRSQGSVKELLSSGRVTPITTMMPRIQIGIARMISADKTISTRLRAAMPITSETTAKPTGSRNHQDAKKPATLIRVTKMNRASATHGSH